MAALLAVMGAMTGVLPATASAVTVGGADTGGGPCKAAGLAIMLRLC